MRERKYKKEQNDSFLQMIKSGKSTFSDIEIIIYYMGTVGAAAPTDSNED